MDFRSGRARCCFPPLVSSTPHFSLEVQEVRYQLGKASAVGSSIWLPGELSWHTCRCSFQACWEAGLLMRCGAPGCHFCELSFDSEWTASHPVSLGGAGTWTHCLLRYLLLCNKSPRNAVVYSGFFLLGILWVGSSGRSPLSRDGSFRLHSELARGGSAGAGGSKMASFMGRWCQLSQRTSWIASIG